MSTTTTTRPANRTTRTMPCACHNDRVRRAAATPARTVRCCIAAALERPLTARELALADAAYTRSA